MRELGGCSKICTTHSVFKTLCLIYTYSAFIGNESILTLKLRSNSDMQTHRQSKRAHQNKTVFTWQSHAPSAWSEPDLYFRFNFFKPLLKKKILVKNRTHANGAWLFLEAVAKNQIHSIPWWILEKRFFQFVLYRNMLYIKKSTSLYTSRYKISIYMRYRLSVCYDIQIKTFDTLLGIRLSKG